MFSLFYFQLNMHLNVLHVIAFMFYFNHKEHLSIFENTVAEIV